MTPKNCCKPRKGSLIGAAAESIGALAGLSIAAAGGWIAYSQFLVNHQVALGNAIDAETKSVSTDAGGVLTTYSSQKAAGRPLFLVHSVNAAASAYEMGPIFNRYRSTRPVLSLDLPGFGLSERSNRLYSPRVYHEAILEVLQSEAKEPVDVVALSLGCEFVARAAAIQPELFHSISFISPTGFGTRRGGERSSLNQRSPEQADRALRLLSLPLWGRPLFDLIATRASIRYFLQLSFTGPVPEDMIDYAYASAHQPGAEHAPLAFLSGKLFTAGIAPAFYERLKMPVRVFHDQDAFIGFDKLPGWIEKHANWQAVRIAPTRGLPQFERMDDLAWELDKFWTAG